VLQFLDVGNGNKDSVGPGKIKPLKRGNVMSTKSMGVVDWEKDNEGASLHGLLSNRLKKKL